MPYFDDKNLRRDDIIEDDIPSVEENPSTNYAPNRVFSEIIYDIDVVKDYLAICQDDDYDDTLLYIIMDSASSYIEDYTQMKREDLDKHYQSSLIFLLIVSELYNNRTISLSTGTNGIYNKLLDKMLVNLKQDWL